MSRKPLGSKVFCTSRLENEVCHCVPELIRILSPVTEGRYLESPNDPNERRPDETQRFPGKIPREGIRVEKREVMYETSGPRRHLPMEQERIEKRDVEAKYLESLDF